MQKRQRNAEKITERLILRERGTYKLPEFYRRPSLFYFILSCIFPSSIH